MRRFYLHMRAGIYYAELVDQETGKKLPPSPRASATRTKPATSCASGSAQASPPPLPARSGPRRKPSPLPRSWRRSERRTLTASDAERIAGSPQVARPAPVLYDSRLPRRGALHGLPHAVLDLRKEPLHRREARPRAADDPRALRALPRPRSPPLVPGLQGEAPRGAHQERHQGLLGVPRKSQAGPSPWYAESHPHSWNDIAPMGL